MRQVSRTSKRREKNAPATYNRQPARKTCEGLNGNAENLTTVLPSCQPLSPMDEQLTKSARKRAEGV